MLCGAVLCCRVVLSMLLMMRMTERGGGHRRRPHASGIFNFWVDVANENQIFNILAPTFSFHSFTRPSTYKHDGRTECDAFEMQTSDTRSDAWPERARYGSERACLVVRTFVGGLRSSSLVGGAGVAKEQSASSCQMRFREA